jgi:hypothetical protein
MEQIHAIEPAAGNTNVVELAAPNGQPNALEAFGIRTLSQLKQRIASLGKTEFLIDGLMSERSLTLVVGDSGIGKSPLVYQALLCFSACVPFVGKKVRQGRTLYMDGENGVQDVAGIVSQLAKHLGVATTPADLLLWNLNDCAEDWKPDGRHLLDLIRAAKPDVVALDPLSAIFPGIEQDNPTATAAFQELRGIMRECGCSFICVHHPRKYDASQITKENSLEFATNLPRWFDSARGPRALINGSDLRIGVEPPFGTNPNEPELIVRGFRRAFGEFPMMRLSRVLDDDGEPVGYNRVGGAQLLAANPEQQEAFKRLPDRFQFRQAMEIYGKQNQATRDFLRKCISAGLLRQPGKGCYEKIPPEAVQELRMVA